MAKKKVVAPSRIPGVFVKVKDGLPDKLGKQSAISSVSGMLSLKTADGVIYNGFYQRWDTNVDAHHIKAKKGDGFFSRIDNVLLPDVVEWLDEN